MQKACIITMMPSYKLSAKLYTFVLLLLVMVARSFATDVTPPSTTISLSPSTPNGKNGWYVSPVAVTLSATDLESGVASINYKLDGMPWQSVSFSNTLNLAPNPSMEDIDQANTPAIQYWSASVLDANTTYTRDTVTYAPNYATTSARIDTTGTGWHGVNNQTNFAAATPMSNMSAAVMLKTQGVTGTAYFNVYMVTQDSFGTKSYTLLGQSSSITGTTDWTQINLNFILNNPNAIGVYIDIGFTGAGTLWADAVSITYANTNPSTSFTVGTDGAHTIEYYSVDNANNSETHSCPNTKCQTLKIDQTPPGSWHDAGAVRAKNGSDHELFVYTNVGDGVSGISGNSNKYMYHIDGKNSSNGTDEFGSYTNLSKCSGTWQPNIWVPNQSLPFTPGSSDVLIETQDTDFCNDNWKLCKTVKFYVEDMAGNSTTKDFCLNGPWLQFTGGGIVKSNGGIDLVSEAPVGQSNTDGLIEVGNQLISFFDSSKNWLLTNAPPSNDYDYAKWMGQVKPAPTTVSGLSTQSGVFKINSSFEIKNNTVPSGYGSSTFSQIVFINGDLTVSTNVTVASGSTALFIVKGKVSINSSVNSLGIGIFADGDFYSAYDLGNGQTTSALSLDGIFVANVFHFQRTLQGTNNTKYPSESFKYEPKYGVNLASYLGTNAVKWLSEK